VLALASVSGSGGCILAGQGCVRASGCGDTMGLGEVGVRWRWRWHWLLISGAGAVGRRILAGTVVGVFWNILGP
jgi:hypothetical protein